MSTCRGGSDVSRRPFVKTVVGMKSSAARMMDVTTPGIYRFSFDATAAMDDVHVCMAMAICAAGGVYGAARVRLEFGYCADDLKRSLVADCRTEIGYTLVCMFTALLLREFDLGAFSVECVKPERDADLVAAGHSH